MSTCLERPAWPLILTSCTTAKCCWWLYGCAHTGAFLVWYFQVECRLVEAYFLFLSLSIFLFFFFSSAAFGLFLLGKGQLNLWKLKYWALIYFPILLWDRW